MKRVVWLLGLATITLSACKKEVTKNVDQDKIWTYYQLFFDESANTTYATATFRFSNEYGTQLMLSDPSNVTIDGAELEWDSESGYYKAEFEGLKATASFTWVDLDGNSFTNEIEIRDIGFPTSVNDLHFGDSVSYFSWEGLALDSSESVSLTIDGAGASDTRVFSIDTIGATTITLDSLTLSQIDSGAITLTLDFRYNPDLKEQTTRGGTIIGRYRPNSVESLLTD